MTSLFDLVQKVKEEMDPKRVGMIACHNGVVRARSRDGLPVEYLEISLDEEAWDKVLREMRAREGIFCIEAHLSTGKRWIGEDLLIVVVAGDVRENVFPVLEETVNRLKEEAIVKRERIRG